MQVLTVAGGILSAIVLVGAAAAAIAKLWQYPWFRWLVYPLTWATRALVEQWQKDRQQRQVALTREALDILFQPNGGASLFDMAQRQTRMEKRMETICDYLGIPVDLDAKEPIEVPDGASESVS